VAGPIETLPDPREAGHARRARSLRRVGLALLWALVLAGALGALGPATGRVSASGPGVSVAVDYPRIARAGVAAAYRVEITRPGGFDTPVEIAVSRSLFERFDYQNFYPTPAEETSEGADVRYRFDPPPGEVFWFVADVRLSPEQNGSFDRYTTRVLLGDSPAATVSFRMLVVP
jgi:hypothetical protein